MHEYCVLKLLYLSCRQCYKADEQNIQCPVCSSVFNELGSSLPFSHSSQSYLICRMSGQPMNEYNPPMLLPNGHVYGEQVSNSWCTVYLFDVGTAVFILDIVF